MPTVPHPPIRRKGPRPAPAPVDGTTTNGDEPPGLSLHQAMERALLLSYKLVHHLSDLERVQQIMRQLMTHRLPLPQQRKASAPMLAMIESIDGDVTVHWQDLLAELTVLVAWLREEQEAAGGPPSA